jgi:hypothetical protein
MKLVQNTVPTPFSATRSAFRWSRPRLVPRRTLPSLGPVQADRGVFEALARIFRRAP